MDAFDQVGTWLGRRLGLGPQGLEWWLGLGQVDNATALTTSRRQSCTATTVGQLLLVPCHADVAG